MAEVVELSSDKVEVRYHLGQYGGGRGVFTTVPVTAGTVIIREEPLLTAPRILMVRSGCYRHGRTSLVTEAGARTAGACPQARFYL